MVIDMKKLRELYDIESDVLIKDVKINSKDVTEGDIFVCTMGVTADRHDYIDDAIEHGASCIVVSRDVGQKSVPVVKVADTNKELISLARRLYDFDDSLLDIIGITGTNGKTTTALIIKHLLGNVCGYIGTNGLLSKNINEPIRNTTPDADRLYKYFRRFIDDDCKYLAMETSSEAFYRNRLDTISFKIGLITNITEDHLNVHKTIENYVDCKMDLIRKVREDGIVILNRDDKYFDLECSNAKTKILTYGKNIESDMCLLSTDIKDNYTVVNFKYDNKEYSVRSPFLGDVNAYNLLGALLVCVSLGCDIEELIKIVPSIPTVAGRLEIMYNNKFTIVLDYAHTTDAFSNILPIMNKLKKNRLIVVTGSAGGREVEKRGPMGKVVLDNSDYVIFTMDDPRCEDVNSIIDDLVSLSDKTSYERIIDREAAIEKAIDMALDGDVILIAGKGCDNYMAVGNEYLPYCDTDVINKLINDKLS